MRPDGRQPGNAPQYSIVITSHNQQEFIRDAVESALSQTGASKEVIVVDDGSRDGSVQILKHYEHSIRLLPLLNGGALEARNRGAAIARGKYLIFLDGDDLMAPWALDAYEKLVEECHPTTIVGLARWFRGPVPTLTREEFPRKLAFVAYENLMAKDRTCGLYTGALVIDRRVFDAVGGWSPGIFYLDLMDLYVKLGYSGTAILICSPYTMLYRMHASNSIGSVPPFLQAAHTIMAKERAGQYPGGSRKRFERYARHGGSVVIFCIQKGLRARMYRDTLRLLARGWSMVFAAIIRRSVIRIKGPRPLQTRELRFQKSSCYGTVTQNRGRGAHVSSAASRSELPIA